MSLETHPFAVYSKQLLNLADYFDRKPFVREAECATRQEAKAIVAQLEPQHPSRLYFDGINVGPEYQLSDSWLGPTD